MRTDAMPILPPFAEGQLATGRVWPRPPRSPRPPRPPGPRGLPLVGHALDIGHDALGFFTACRDRYGDVVALRLGAWPVLLLNDPAHIEHVLVKEHRSYAKHPLFWRQVTAIFGRGLLTSEGEAWLRQRRLMAPAFAGQRRLAAYADAMVRHARAMLDGPAWRRNDGGEVSVLDLHQAMMALTLRIAAETLFGCEVERDVAAIDRAVDALTAEIASRFTRPVLIPDAVPLPGHLRYRRALRAIEDVVERIVRERRSSRPDDDDSDGAGDAADDAAGDLLSTLLAARDEAGRAMPDRQLRDEMVTLLLAGHETTALALSWTWHLLCQHPEVQEELAAEVDAVAGRRRAVTLADLPGLRLCEQVVTEAMRLYPPAWAIGRAAVRDCEVGGYPVPAGTTLYMSPWVVQRDGRHFDDPTAFRPERWSGGALEKRLPRFAYFPFGGGPRVCIGQRFATIEAVLILATMAQRVRLTACDGQRDRDRRPVVPLPSITLRPKGGVWTRVEAR